MHRELVGAVSEHDHRSASNAAEPAGSKTQVDTGNGAADGAMDSNPTQSHVINGINTQADAYYKASWKDHAYFFQWGVPVDGNPNLRRYDFSQGGYVTIQAHVPELTFTSESNATVASAFLLGMGSGALAALVGMAEGGGLAGVGGLVVGVGFGALIGGSLGAVAAATSRPYDAAWQGYTVNYYEKNSTRRWGSYRFYGWKRSPKPLTEFARNGETNPDKFPDFAMTPEEFTWHHWTPVIATAKRQMTQARAKRSILPEPAVAHQLVQAMAGSMPASGSSSASIRPTDVDARSAALLLASPMVA